MIEKITVTDTLKKMLATMTPQVQQAAIEIVMSVAAQAKNALNQGARHELALGLFQTMEERLQQTSNAPEVKCAKGCHFCCHMNVDVGAQEAMLITLRHKDKIDYDYLNKQVGYDRTTWRNLPPENRTCVFLKNGECSIYQDRPFACRKYFSSTPHLCGDINGTTEVVADTMAECVASGMFAVVESGGMAEMLIKYKDYDADTVRAHEIHQAGPGSGVAGSVAGDQDSSEGGVALSDLPELNDGNRPVLILEDGFDPLQLAELKAKHKDLVIIDRSKPVVAPPTEIQMQQYITRMPKKSGKQSRRERRAAERRKRKW